MNKKKIKILCTLGPSTINKKFLRFARGKISLLRLNMSHIEVNKLPKIIRYIKKNSNIPICLDTEGAQVRTKVKKSKYYKMNQIIKLEKKKGNFKIYPNYIFKMLKKNDLLDIGFNNLKIKLIKIKSNYISSKVISPGILEHNKGIHIINRHINLNYLTEKDYKAIEIGKYFKIKNYALSFTNSVHDIKKFNKILKNCKKIYKIETMRAVRDFGKLIKLNDEFLIDRGDLSKETLVENIPLIQRKIFKNANKYKNKKIYVATNLLESMIFNKFPTRGEANDIFNSLEMGASGLVLAAETAVGKYPIDAVIFLRKMIKTYKQN